MKPLPILTVLLLLLAVGPARAGEIEAEAGLTLNNAVMTWEYPYNSDWGVLSRARLQAKVYLGDKATLEAHYQATLAVGPGAGQGSPIASSVTRLRQADLDRELDSGGDYLLLQNLDRLWLNLDLGPVLAGLGRQVIGHGPGRIFNPTDIFAPLPTLTTYSEYKNGVDAIRLTHPLEQGGELELIGVTHRDGLDQGIGVVRTALQFSGWNFSAYGGYSLGRPTLALALSGDLGDTGWYAEALGRLRDSRMFRGCLGLDYRFPFDLEVVAEVLFQSDGAGDEEGYSRVQASRSFREGEMYLAGRWYAALYLGYEITPLIKGELTWVHNLGDGSAVLSGGVSWDLADWILLRAGVLAGIGNQTALTPEGLATGSEFGDYGTAMYLEVRLTF